MISWVRSVVSTSTKETVQNEPFRTITEFALGIGVHPIGSTSTSSVSVFPS